MHNMFTNLYRVSELNLSSFDTSQVTNMDRMFQYSKMAKIILPKNFGISATKANYMFYFCDNLENINTENFNTSNLEIATSMFNSCSSLSSLNLSTFDTTNVTNMSNMFYGCESLTSILFGPKFVHKENVNIDDMFYNCPSQDRPTDSSWQGVSF